MIDNLAAYFSRTLTFRWINDTAFPLHYDIDTKRVTSFDRIPADYRIGVVAGEPAYIWDMKHEDYVIVEEEMVLDVSELSPRPILTLVRSVYDVEERSPDPNCFIEAIHDHAAKRTVCFLRTTREVRAGDELVYAPPFANW